MRKVLLAIGALFVVLILAVLVGPSFVDWGQYRSQIANAARDATGRELSVDGAISLSLLPAPTLSVAQVALANAPGGSAEPMVTLDALDIRLALRPLLSGEIQVESLSLKRPRVLLERRADGSGNWQFGAPPEAQTQATDGRSAAGADAASSDGGLGQRVALDQARVEDGTLIYRDLETGAAYEVTALTGAFSLDSLTGPYEVAVEGRLDELPFSLGGRVEAMTEGQASRVALILGMGKAEAKLSGRASLAGDAPSFDGTLAAQGPDLGAVLAALGGGAGHGVERLPFEMDGALTASAQAVRYEQVKLQIGDSRFAGTASATFDPRTEFALALSATRVNLDDLLTASASMSPPESSGTGTDGAGTEAAPSGTAGAPDPKPAKSDDAGAFPTDLTASVDVRVETLVYRGKPARNLKANLLLSDGELTLNEASVGLPGDTNLSLFGFVAGSDGAAKFDGSAEVSSSNFREALNWLGTDLSGVPADRMRRLEAKSAIVASRNEVLLNGLQVSLDTSRLNGSVRLVPGDRLGIGARVAIDKVDLDAYHGAAETADAQKPDAPAGSDQAADQDDDAKADAKEADADPPWHQRVDVNAIVEAQSIRLNQQTIGGVRLDGQLLDGTVTVRRLDVASLAGAKLNVTDAVKALDGGPEFSLGGFSLSAQDP
ncbi:MAG: AsmA family protein, partial [Alphaproteobacteria bacterium]|nr:AsmA family protein [Alphaproteobacteria bacterium]